MSSTCYTKSFFRRVKNLPESFSMKVFIVIVSMISGKQLPYF